MSLYLKGNTMNKMKELSLLLLTSTLFSCGGSSDSSSDNNNNNGGNTGSGMTYVAGDFKTASSTDEYAPSDIGAYGLSSGVCMGESYYFESANILVYGSSSLPEVDFKYAATLVENKLNEAFDLMGITRAEFDEYRPQYTPQVAMNVLRFLDYHRSADGVDSDITDIPNTGFDIPDGWESMSGIDKESALNGYWNTISDSKQVELVNIYLEYDQRPDFLDGNKLPSKIGVCLDSSMNESLYGQGTLLGMNLAPKSVADRSDAQQVVLHELIHAIQINVSTPIDTTEPVNDLWFMEGQATFLAGQTVASSASGYYPVSVVDSYDAGNLFQGDDGLAYTHYAKAYSYLNAHSTKEQIKTFLLAVRTYGNGGENGGYSGVSSDRFTEAFNANMKKTDDSQLTIKDFRTNYHSLMSNQ